MGKHSAKGIEQSVTKVYNMLSPLCNLFLSSRLYVFSSLHCLYSLLYALCAVRYALNPSDSDCIHKRSFHPVEYQNAKEQHHHGKYTAISQVLGIDCAGAQETEAKDFHDWRHGIGQHDPFKLFRNH